MKKLKNNNISKGWQKVKLGEIGKIITGKTPPTVNPENFGGQYPFITIPDMKDQKYIKKTERTISEKGAKIMKNLKIPPKAVVVSCLATVGEVGITVKESFTNQQINSVICDENKIIPEFLYYSLKYSKSRLLKYSGSVYTNISKSKFADFEIETPQDINEQKRIADILSAFDDKIEVNNKIIKTLEEMAQEIFKEWFNENLKFKSQKSKSWETIKISDLAWIISGYPFSSKLYNKSKEGLGVVTIKNVQDGNFITECDSFIEEKKIPKNMNQECLISDGDILLSLTGNVGRVCFVYGGKYLLNQRVAKLKPKNPNDLAFIYFLFRQPDMQNLLINMAKGSAQPNLSPVETGEIEVTIPTREILDKPNKVINPIYEKLIKLKVENQTLAALRDLLLSKLMSGEIRV